MSLRIDSAEIRANSGEMSRKSRASDSSATKANSRWPERIFDAPYSTDAISHAERIRSTTRGARAGGRALPVLKWSIAPVRARITRDVSIS
jgi:hypothetical protein